MPFVVSSVKLPEQELSKDPLFFPAERRVSGAACSSPSPTHDVIRLTLTVESKSQGVASASKSMRAIAKNGSKKKVGIRF